MKKGDVVTVGPNADHPAVTEALAVIQKDFQPVLDKAMRKVRAEIPGIEHCLAILFTAEGRVATVVGDAEDIDVVLAAITSAGALLETQKVKS